MLAMKAIFQTYSMGRSICKLTKPGKRDIHCTHRTKSFFTTIPIDTTDPYSTSTKKKVSHQKKRIVLSEMREKHRSVRFAESFLEIKNICGKCTRSSELIFSDRH